MAALNSKFTVPKRREIFSRKRLIRLFEDNPDKKLFVVTAGAGFGKTTLVVDALSEMAPDCAWYKLDEQDIDFHVFLTHLYTLVLHQFPGGRKKTPEALFPSGILEKTSVLIKWLSFLQEQIHRPSVIILDDYHLVQESIVEIDEADLCFSGPEIAQFFKNHAPMEPADIDSIKRSTNGWAASLVLLKHTILKQPHASLTENLSKFAQKPDAVFSYLEENVFNLQPVHIREFMMKAALLPEIDSSKCQEIFQIKNAGQILNLMIKDHLMIFPVNESGTVFTLHHLFRDFLLNKLNDHFPAEEINRLHCRIAESFKRSDIDLALWHFVAGKNFDQAVAIIEAHEMDFLIRGKVEFLDRVLQQIPQLIVDENPQILLSQSRICSHAGDPEKAIVLTSKALKKLQHQKKKDKIISCVIELGMQYYYTGHLKEAKLMMEQVLENIEKQSQTYVMAMTFLTFLPSILGEFETSRKYERAARKEISNYPEYKKQIATLLLDTSLSHTLFFMGEFEYSQQVSQKLLDAVLQMNIDPCLPLVYYQLSANCFFLGEYETGCGYAEKGVDICKKLSLSDSRKAWNHLAWAQNHMGCQQLEKAQEQLNISTRLFEGPGNRWGLASTQECQAQIYFEQNRTRPALRILENALDLIKGYGLKVTRAILETGTDRPKSVFSE
ncbi:MAG: hypothetical protein KKE62_18280 [Proteobacteria bacterium]|nr:hypothetical protein [Pseudomonadota bacterium]MBU1389221.1 hypothetical protein [Pseudomonadota bacterium]MBU1544785.1 hypothetical protein [Pseudomonadota bacterium]MBU2429292.1 hypothetical protein [Pseudomonadota bacterium]MBU2481889.1 hypothetical protein [Pseudomonadota bacterium]